MKQFIAVSPPRPGETLRIEQSELLAQQLRSRRITEILHGHGESSHLARKLQPALGATGVRPMFHPAFAEVNYSEESGQPGLHPKKSQELVEDLVVQQGEKETEGTTLFVTPASALRMLRAVVGGKPELAPDMQIDSRRAYEIGLPPHVVERVGRQRVEQEMLESPVDYTLLEDHPPLTEELSEEIEAA